MATWAPLFNVCNPTEIWTRWSELIGSSHAYYSELVGSINSRLKLRASSGGAKRRVFTFSAILRGITIRYLTNQNGGANQGKAARVLEFCHNELTRGLSIGTRDTNTRARLRERQMATRPP